ncbi:MAG: HAMP domain-containing protein [Anaerolineae bacterium]|nr:HAMP domain-containing protein [Anaerolineae bacterium]
MFTGLRARLMLSFSLLLLVCLGILTTTFVLLFFVWVSLPELASARLLDASGSMVTHVRSLVQQGQRLPESIESVQTLTRERGMRMLAVTVTVSGGRIVADSEGEWAGERIGLVLSAKQREEIRAQRSPQLRGRLRAPDGRLLYYVAVPVSLTQGDAPRLLYLALTMTAREAARPFIGSLLISVLLAGLVAFALSILLAFWLSQSLARPLQRAAIAAERVATGDYTVSLDIAAPDEARRLADSFNTMTRAVQASQQSQRDFVANVSHELRTPLTSIQGFAQAILDGTANDGPAIRRAAGVIVDEAERLARMVRNLLDLARLESGDVPMARNEVDLVALLQGCVSRLDLLARKKKVALVLDTSPAASITGDGDRLMQVFTNLIDNAIKHTGDGGKVTVQFADVRPEMVGVEVRDTGRGIPQDELPRVFERFYQVDKSRTRQTGAGLGLSIALEIVRAHGGDIIVQSEVGQGTVFKVVLPSKVG